MRETQRQTEESHYGPEEARSQTLTDSFMMAQDEKIVEFFRGGSIFYDQGSADYRNKASMDELVLDFAISLGFESDKCTFFSFILCYSLNQLEKLTYKPKRS